MHTIKRRASLVAASAFFAALGAAITRLAGASAELRRRDARRLPDHLLRDIGLDPHEPNRQAEAERERMRIATARRF